MAKRRSNEWTSELVDFPEEEEIQPEFLEEIILKEPETVKIMHMRDVILNYTGAVTGKLYRFNRGGSVQDVDKRDAEIMLKRGEQASCCGSVSTPYFEIVR